MPPVLGRGRRRTSEDKGWCRYTFVRRGMGAGTHVGRVVVRASGSFDIRTKVGRQAGINARYCQPIHRNDGYSYQKGDPYAAPVSAAQTTREEALGSSPV